MWRRNSSPSTSRRATPTRPSSCQRFAAAVYHLLFDKVLRTAERQYFSPLLRSLNKALLVGLTSGTRRCVTPPGRMRRCACWPTSALPAACWTRKPLCRRMPGVAGGCRLALIAAAEGIQPSPIFPGLDYGEDYTRYIPRGHYTLDDGLKAYFRTMMWYGRMTFRLKTSSPEVGRAETRSALLLVNALRQRHRGRTTRHGGLGGSVRPDRLLRRPQRRSWWWRTTPS
ncbi:MAG: DUF3160 domain-containing protein [Gammaproteobacteria bacterium]|nr:DUF3160 domain-containing protein [Gammaproteobacteria bacterium]